VAAQQTLSPSTERALKHKRKYVTKNKNTLIKTKKKLNISGESEKE